MPGSSAGALVLAVTEGPTAGYDPVEQTETSGGISAMLLKKAGDKSKRLKLLEDLQQSHALDARQKDWLQQELEIGRAHV